MITGTYLIPRSLFLSSSASRNSRSCSPIARARAPRASSPVSGHGLNWLRRKLSFSPQALAISSALVFPKMSLISLQNSEIALPLRRRCSNSETDFLSRSSASKKFLFLSSSVITLFCNTNHLHERPLVLGSYPFSGEILRASTRNRKRFLRVSQLIDFK